MRVGFVVTKYGYNSCTRRAIRLAETARKFAEVGIYSEIGESLPAVNPALDGQVVRARVADFGNWAKSRSHICWVSLPSAKQLTRAGPDAMRLLLLDWHTHSIEAVRLLTQVDRIVAPSQAAFLSALDNFVGRDVRHLHWSPGLPLVSRQPGVDRRVAVVLPASGDQGACLELVRRLLERCTLTGLDVFYFRAEVPDAVLARFRGLERLWGSVLNLVPVSRLDRYTLAARFSKVNLVVVPSVAATTGMTVQLALACGVPVVCYDIAPYNEYVRHGVDGWLVPCRVQRNPLQAQRAIADFRAVEAIVAAALRNWPSIDQPVLAECVGDPLRFAEQWRDVLQN